VRQHVQVEGVPWGGGGEKGRVTERKGGGESGGEYGKREKGGRGRERDHTFLYGAGSLSLLFSALLCSSLLFSTLLLPLTDTASSTLPLRPPRMRARRRKRRKKEKQAQCHYTS
jgi:hypothetical protein